jgi:tetratricopeptide (TPR) repeat protein
MGITGETTPVVPKFRRWLPQVASALLVPVLLLGMVEAGLRILGVGNDTSFTRPCTDHGAPGFCDNPFFPAAFFPPGMARTPRPFVIPAAKPARTFRIVVLGESAAYGDPDPTYGFARYLEMMLRERFPEVNFEITNTGITAINSHVLLPIAKELAQHQPDLFIIYAGNNEAIGPFGPGTVLTQSGMSLPAIRANIFFNSTRLGQLLAKLRSEEKPQNWRGMEMFLEKQVPADSPLIGQVYKNYASNLRDIVAVAHSSGARVVVGTIATNLKDCAPFASSHRPRLNPEELRSWSVLFEQGQALENAKSYVEALKVYRRAADIDDQYAELAYRMARSLWNLGEYREAKEFFVRARDLDTLRFRADSRINDINRSIASSSLGVELVDAEELFSNESPNGVIGSELVYEHVHPTPHGNYILARALFAQVSSKLPSSLVGDAEPSGWEPPSEVDTERLLAFTPFDRARVASLVLNKLDRPPFTNQSNHPEQVLRMQAEAQGPVDSYDDTAAQYQWAIARNPQDRLLYLNYGFLVYMRDPVAATEQFRRALPYDNAPVLCNWRKFN